MNRRPLCFFVAPLVLAAVSVPAFLSPAANAGSNASVREGALDDSMQTLQAGVKGLDKAIEKKEGDKALGLVADMQKAAHEAKALAPAKAAEVSDAAEKTKFMNGYKLKLIELEHGLLDVEAALIEGKWDDAKKALDAKVKPTKKAGHDAYKD